MQCSNCGNTDPNYLLLSDELSFDLLPEIAGFHFANNKTQIIATAVQCLKCSQNWTDTRYV